MKDQSVIKAAVCKADKIPDRFRRDIGVQFTLHDATIRHGDAKPGILKCTHTFSSAFI